MTQCFFHLTCFAKVFLVLLFVYLKHDIFIMKICFITHIARDIIISPLLRLLLKAWIWCRCQNRKLYHHDGERSGFYKNAHIKTQSKKKEYLLKRGTTWNHLKLAESTWNLPETTCNHLKPAICSTPNFFDKQLVPELSPESCLYFRVLLIRAPTSTQLHPPPLSCIYLHPAHFNLHPAPLTSS